MHHRVAINKNYNIYYSPVVDPRFIADQGAQITCGDMHGNSMKFLSILVNHGFLKILPHEMHELASIYNTSIDELTKAEYDRFCAIVANAEVNPEATSATLRAIGDKWGDRGMGDQFTLPIIKKLGKSHIPWTVCLSNHDMNLIRCYENGENFYAAEVTENCSPSIYALQECIDKGFISRKEVDHIIKKYYLPHLRVSDYTINAKRQLTKYMHAPFDDTMVAKVAHQIDVKYLAMSPEIEKMCQDEMHRIFQAEYVNKGIISSLVYEESAVQESIWNRKRNFLIRHRDKMYVNGHSPVLLGEHTPANVVELDNETGKNRFQDSYFKREEYKVFYSHDSQDFDNENFDEINLIVPTPEIINFFDKDGLNLLIQPDKIYSRMQIRCLQDFLCKPNSIEIWKEICGDDQLRSVTFQVSISANYELWDVMYLLQKNDLLNMNTFDILITNSHAAENIYQILLILDDAGRLSKEVNIDNILSATSRHADVYDYLIELRHAVGLVAPDLYNILEKIIKNVRLKSIIDKTKALNSFYIFYPLAKNHLTSDLVEEYLINNTIATSTDSEANIRAYCSYLETIYQESLSDTTDDSCNASASEDEIVFYDEPDYSAITLADKEALFRLLLLQYDIEDSVIIQWTAVLSGDAVQVAIDWAVMVMSVAENISEREIVCATAYEQIQLKSIVSWFSMLKNNQLLDKDSLNFVNLHPQAVCHYHECVEIFNNELSKDLWDILKRYKNGIDSDFIANLKLIMLEHKDLEITPNQMREYISKAILNKTYISDESRSVTLYACPIVQDMSKRDVTNEVSSGFYYS